MTVNTIINTLNIIFLIKIFNILLFSKIALSKITQIGMRLAFIKGRYQVIAVTEAEGKHFNKANLKFIVHWGLPSSLLAYYKQSTEAGKDGSQVRCRIYLQNKKLLEYNHRTHKLIDSSLKHALSKEERENAQKLMKMFFMAREIADYCTSTKYVIFKLYFSFFRI